VRAAALGLLIPAAMMAVPLSAWALANPASVFCVQTGGKSESVQTASGAQFGVCILPGGEIVDEWAYFRARHPQPPGSPPLGTPSWGW
jgi:putative hemolysin